MVSIRLKDFICLVPDSPVLLREKVFGQNDINIMKGEVVKLGNNVLKDFTKDERTSQCRTSITFLFERVQLMRRGCAP